MMVKDLVWKIREFNKALEHDIFFAIVCLFFILLLPLLIYFGGFLLGILYLVAASLGNLPAFTKKKKAGLNPFKTVHYWGWHPFRHMWDDKEFCMKVDKYMKKVALGYKPWKVTLLSYVAPAIMIVLFPNGTGTVMSTGTLIVLTFISGVYALLVGALHTLAVSLKAKNSNRMSKFFGVPQSEWRLDLIHVKRPTSITGLTVLFYGLAVFGFNLALAMLVGKVLNIRLIIPLEDTAWIVVGSAGAAIIGGFCLVTAHYLRKMRKDGAGGAVILCLLVLFVDVFAFVLEPLDPRTPSWPIAPYHTIWMFGGPLAIIFIIKRNWRKFKG